MSLIQKEETIKNIVLIKHDKFNIQYINFKFINEYSFNINYKSPSIFLDGIYLKMPDQIFNNSMLYNTKNRKQKVILLNLDTTDIRFNKKIIGFINILININKKISDYIATLYNIKLAPNNYHKQELFIENLLLSTDKFAPSLNLLTNNLENYKSFIKKIITKQNKQYWVIIINNYMLKENCEEYNNLKKDIYIKIDMVENKFNYNYCRTTLNYKNL
jgi:hypothetical protein